MALTAGLACALVAGLPISAAAASPDFVDKLARGTTERVSVSSTGAEGNHDSGGACEIPAGPQVGVPTQYSVSDDGRFIAFASFAGNLHPGDVNGQAMSDVFVHDRKKDKLELVSALPAGMSPEVPAVVDLAPCQTRFGSFDPKLSGNGRYVAFTSPLPMTGEIDPLETAPFHKVFVRDLKTGETEFVSRTWNGEVADNNSGTGESSVDLGISISDDGRWVAFSSRATNILEGACPSQEVVPGAANPLPLCRQVYARDRKRDETVLVSKSTEDMPTTYEAFYPALSGNGRYVAFAVQNTAGGACPEISAGCSDIFVNDLPNGKTELVSVSRDPRPTGGGSGEAVMGSVGHSISDDGRYVTFVSQASDLVPANPPPDLLGSICSRSQYVRDRKTGRTERVSVTSTGAIMHGGAQPQLSADGRYSLYRATSFNGVCLDNVTDEQNAVFGSFIYDRATGQADWVSCPGNQNAGPGGDSKDCPRIASEYSPPVLGSSARFLVGSHYDENAVANDTNDAYDVFFRDIGRYPLGTGLYGGSPPQEPVPPDQGICITSDICIPPLGEVSRRAGAAAAAGQDLTMLPTGAKLYGASLAYRPELGDLYAAIELEHMGPGLTIGPVGIFMGGNPSLLYGLRFQVRDKSYEVRATSLLGGTFGLFDCTAPIDCTKVASLRGGYGTTGERVVISLPLDDIGLTAGGRLRDVEAFSGLGSYLTGASKVLDRVRLK